MKQEHFYDGLIFSLRFVLRPTKTFYFDLDEFGPILYDF